MKFYLAPMEGLTTYNFRTAWNRYYGGMDKYFTPFICNRNMNSRERNDVLPEHNVGMNTVPQILTNKAEEFLELARILAELGYREVNLNLGCPSGTVVSRKRGAGFLSVPGELDAFLDEIFSKCTIPISIKTRIGMTSLGEWSGLLDIFEKYPIAELTIHPRLQAEGYRGTPHTEAYAEAASRLSCPLCYNGDITSKEALDKITDALPGVSAVMVGRGILQDPGLLNKLKADDTGNRDTDPVEHGKTLREFHDAVLEGYVRIMSGDTNTLYKMKDLWTFLSKSFVSPEKQVKKIRKSTDIATYKLAVDALFRECLLKIPSVYAPPHHPRGTVQHTKDIAEGYGRNYQ